MDLRDDQIQSLQRIFMVCPYPDESQRANLARDLGLQVQQIRCWFVNQRARTGLEEEVDPDDDFSSSEDDDDDSKDEDDYSKDDGKRKKDGNKIH